MDFQRLKQLVWTFRDELEADWPTPDMLDSVRFASTEMGEAMRDELSMRVIMATTDTDSGLKMASAKVELALDAELRQKQYSRNNQRTLKVAEEIADAAMMWITALWREYSIEFSDDTAVDACSIEDLNYFAAKAARLARYGEDLSAKAYAEYCLRIADALVEDLGGEIEKRLMRRREKIRAQKAKQ